MDQEELIKTLKDMTDQLAAIKDTVNETRTMLEKVMKCPSVKDGVLGYGEI